MSRNKAIRDLTKEIMLECFAAATIKKHLMAKEKVSGRKKMDSFGTLNQQGCTEKYQYKYSYTSWM